MGCDSFQDTYFLGNMPTWIIIFTYTGKSDAFFIALQYKVVSFCRNPFFRLNMQDQMPFNRGPKTDLRFILLGRVHAPLSVKNRLYVAATRFSISGLWVILIDFFSYHIIHTFLYMATRDRSFFLTNHYPSSLILSCY